MRHRARGWLRADRERGINFWASIPFLIRTPEINRVDFIFSQDSVKRFRFRFENWKASSDRELDIRSTEKSTRSMTSEAFDGINRRVKSR